jgi:peroxiredoxin
MNARLVGFFLLVVLAAVIPAAMAQEMGDFTLETTGGELFTLSDYLGEKVILITFFTAYCKPCMEEHPQLERMWREYGERGLLVVAVNSDEPGNIAKVHNWIRRYKLTFPVLLDSDFAITRQYDPDETFPLSLLIGRDRRIQHIYSGYNTGDEKEIEADLLELLEGGQ